MTRLEKKEGDDTNSVLSTCSKLHNNVVETVFLEIFCRKVKHLRKENQSYCHDIIYENTVYIIKTAAQKQ